MLYDWYTLEQDIHDQDVGWQCHAEETQLLCVVAKHVSDQDLAHQNKCVYQQIFDTISRDVRVHIKLPSKMVQTRRQHDDLWGKINKFRIRRDAAETKHASVRFPRDIEYHCRMFKVTAADTLRKWISPNPLTNSGQISFKCDLTVPRNQVRFFPFFDPDKRPGGLGSERYASYHGW